MREMPAMASPEEWEASSFWKGTILPVGPASAASQGITLPSAAPAMMISQALRARLFRKAADWGAFRMLTCFGLPFIALGVLFHVELPIQAVALFLGAFLFVMMPLNRCLAGKSIAVPSKPIAASTVPYRFILGTSFGAGMILVTLVLKAGITGESLLATVAVGVVMLNVTKTVAFGLSPLLTAELAALGVALGLCTFPGHAVGRWIVRRNSIRVHTLVLETFVGIGAVYMLWKGMLG
ncbi:MAG: hypothetical protein OXI66_14835 [Boseongicola sp.]|nr:hypothetical protein [Boseongicola sp.]